MNIHISKSEHSETQIFVLYDYKEIPLHKQLTDSFFFEGWVRGESVVGRGYVGEQRSLMYDIIMS